MNQTIIFLIIFILVFVVGIVAGVVFVLRVMEDSKNKDCKNPGSRSKSGKTECRTRDDRGAGKKKKGLVERQAEVKAKKKKELLEFIAKKKVVTNNQVEKFLSVSDATTERYLDQLEKEGKIKQMGKGRGVHYKIR